MSNENPLQIAQCHWCEEKIARSNRNENWRTFDDNMNEECMFHPLAWNEELFEYTGQSAPHMTTIEVHDLVRNEYIRRKNLEIEPRRPLRSNVVKVKRNAQRTSREAAEKVLLKTGSRRQRVYDYFLSIGGYGSTDEEAQTYLGISGNSFRPIRKSLVDDGYLMDSNRLRKNENGHNCIVWITLEAQYRPDMRNLLSQ